MAVVSEAAGGRTFPRLQWSAVIAGVFLAVAVHVVMGLVGATLGFAAEPADSGGMGAAAAIWALVTPFVASLLGAWLACRMTNAADEPRTAYLHGILVWCIGLIAGAIFLTGTLATGALSAGAAASGGLADRAIRQGTGAEVGPGPAGREARADEAARRAAAGTGGAALGAIAGLLGAVVGAALAGRRGEGKGLGWRIALERRDDGRARPLRGAGAGTTFPQTRAPGQGGTPPDVGPPPDPYHH
jgi:hypothetical protein